MKRLSQHDPTHIKKAMNNNDTTGKLRHWHGLSIDPQTSVLLWVTWNREKGCVVVLTVISASKPHQIILLFLFMTKHVLVQ